MLITDHLKDHRHDASDRARTPARPSDPRVLIADDQSDVLEALRLLLKAEGFHLETASSPAGVLATLEAREIQQVADDALEPPRLFHDDLDVSLARRGIDGEL